MATSVTLVLFDMEGVLTHYDRAVRVERLSKLTGQPDAMIRHAIWDSGLEARSDAGEIGDDAYLDALSGMLAHRVTRDEWLISRRASITPNRDVIALAERVAKRRRIAVLTNNGTLVTDHMDYLNPAVAELFGSHIYGTAMFGATKPAPQAYLGCLDKLGVRPHETLFIDDSDANVTGAIDAGLLAYKFVSADALARELDRLALI